MPWWLMSVRFQRNYRGNGRSKIVYYLGGGGGGIIDHSVEIWSTREMRNERGGEFTSSRKDTGDEHTQHTIANSFYLQQTKSATKTALAPTPIQHLNYTI